MQKKDLRIDYSKYEVDEVVETVSDAILFPFYIGEVAVKVLAVFLVGLSVLTYFTTGGLLSGIALFILSLLISVPTLIITTLISLLHTIQSDLNKVIGITVDTAKYIYKDVGLLGEQHANKVSVKTSFYDVFKGVAYYVIRPALTKTLEKRLKFMAGPITFFVDLIFKRMVRKQKKMELEAIPETEAGSEGETTNSSPNDLTVKIKGGSSAVSGVAFKVLRFPLLVIGIWYGVINFAIVYLLTKVL